MFSIASWNDESRVCSFAKYMEIYRKYTEYDVIFSYYLLIHNLKLFLQVNIPTTLIKQIFVLCIMTCAQDVRLW